MARRIGHGNLSLPLGIEQIVKALGHIGGFHQFRVIQNADGSNPPRDQLAVAIFEFPGKIRRARWRELGIDVVLFPQGDGPAGADHDIETGLASTPLG